MSLHRIFRNTNGLKGYNLLLRNNVRVNIAASFFCAGGKMLESVKVPIVPHVERLCAILPHIIIIYMLLPYITYLLCREGVRVSSAAS